MKNRINNTQLLYEYFTNDVLIVIIVLEYKQKNYLLNNNKL
jgi:hypothetical protein